MRHEPDAQPDTWRIALAACFWIALAGSFIELSVLGLRQLKHPMLTVSADYYATVPMALIAVVLLAASPFIAISGRFRRAGHAALLVATAIVLFDLLLLIPRLAPWAALLLAAGAAARISVVMWRNVAGLRQAVRRSLPVIAVLVLVAGGIIRARTALVKPAIGGAAPTGLNVILITLDTVRAANMSLYGYARDTTPSLASHAKGGVVFEHAFSTAPWTLPSHASLMTGHWPHELTAGYDTPLDKTFPTIGEHLAAHGYRTAGFAANLGYCSRGTGLARGFSTFFDYPRSLGQVVSNSTVLRTIADNFTLRRVIGNDEHLNRVSAEDINSRFLQWLDRQDGNPAIPFFAFLNYFDAHEPYLPPPPFNTKFGTARARARVSPLHHAQWDPAAATHELAPDALREEADAYDDAIAYLDQQVGALLDRLASRGILQRTVVVITADHGEEFAEHRVLEHGYSLYRNSLQVPLIVLQPTGPPNGPPAGSDQQVRRIDTPVSLRDVAATIVDVTGTGSPQDFAGTSLRRVWSSGAAGYDTPVLSELRRPPGGQPDWYPVHKGDMQAIVHEGLRYIRNGDGSEELYALDDPLERHNLVGSADRQQAVAAARARLDAALRAGR